MKLLYDQPLWIPAGSVRAILALMLAIGYLFNIVEEEILFLVLGFYFGQRLGAERTQREVLADHGRVEDPDADAL